MKYNKLMGKNLLYYLVFINKLECIILIIKKYAIGECILFPEAFPNLNIGVSPIAVGYCWIKRSE